VRDYKTFSEAEEEIRARINKACYSRPMDIKGAYCAWLDYADLLERHGNPEFIFADQIADGYSYRGLILLRGAEHRRKMDEKR
jgi:hypothetical protein